MIEQTEKISLFIDLLKSNTDLDVYKECASDYFKGRKPFLFLSYGITYDEMLYFAKFSIEFLNFIFDFLF